MARLWTCGFELQSVTAGVEILSVTGTPTISTTVKRLGTASLRINPTAATQYAEQQVTAGGVIRTLHRFYLRIATLPAATTPVYSIGQSSYFPCYLRLSAAGTLQLHDAFLGVSVGTASAALTVGQWYRVEIDHTDVAGAESPPGTRPKGDVIAYLDGTNFSGTTQISNINGFSRIRMGTAVAGTMDINIDDVAVNDTTGTAQNGLPGAGNVIHLKPDAAGDNNLWATAVGGTAGAANNYTRVNETTPDNATSYNQTAATGTTAIDDFNLGAPFAAGITARDTITLVAVGGRVGSIAATAASIVYRIKSQAAGTVTESASVSVALNGWATHKATAPNVHQLTSYTDPQAGGAWTRALLETAQIGYRANVSQTTTRRVSTLWALVEFVPAAINLVGSLRDDFNDSTIDTGKWVNNFGTVSETGGRARVTCDTGYSAFSSGQVYTLQNSQLTIRVYPPADGGATDEAWAQVLILSGTSGVDAGFEIDASASAEGTLTCFNRSGFFDPTATTITYSPTDHAYLRLRESAGTLYWDTSANGRVWTNRKTTASPPWVADTINELQLIAHRDAGTADYAEFDNVNIPMGARVWTGTEWKPCPVRTWDGSAWQLRTVKTRTSGGTWI